MILYKLIDIAFFFSLFSSLSFAIGWLDVGIPHLDIIISLGLMQISISILLFHIVIIIYDHIRMKEG